VRSLKEGATDFILKPWRNDKMIATIADAYQKSVSKVKKPSQVEVKENNQPKENVGFTELIGDSEAMMDVRKKIEKVAPTDANILILGENGTGKDLVAKSLHKHSLRADKPFVSVDLGALSETLFESELFGHKKGAYTDAKEDRPGRFEVANGGTIFLDEIGNISLPHQAKLLTALQNRQVTRLGTNKPIDIDIRLICATNMPIYEMALNNRFRKDLIYRVNTVEITLPPLRQRGNDVTILAEHFAGIYAKKYNKATPQFEESTLKKLRQYSWHGNVRELQHAVERAVIMAERSVLRPEDFVFTSFENTPEQNQPTEELRLDEMEKNTILRVIEKHQGNITKAARELGITRTALYRRLEKHDI
jgi:two-component system, NtrC family, response regulator HydG